MWDVRGKRNEQQWAKGLSKLIKETLDTTRTWMSFVFASAAINFLVFDDATSSLNIVSAVLLWFANLALLRYFFLEMGVRNILDRDDRVGQIVDFCINFILFGMSYWLLSILVSTPIRDAIVSIKSAT
jgi:hypothetical protein